MKVAKVSQGSPTSPSSQSHHKYLHATLRSTQTDRLRLVVGVNLQRQKSGPPLSGAARASQVSIRIRRAIEG
eukprot:4571634-Pyramimonas_sp.AAC.2